MAASAHRVHYTLTEYLAFEASSNVKHEYLDGQIYAMAGGTPEHAALAAAVVGQLYPQLRDGRCRVHSADLRFRVAATGLLTYPDVTVVCGPSARDADDPLAVTNPTLIVEVLSPSTEEYDRGEKFDHYKQTPSLREFALVSCRDRSVEVWQRQEDGDAWVATVFGEGEAALLPSIGASVDVRELYRAAAEPGA